MPGDAPAHSRVRRRLGQRAQREGADQRAHRRYGERHPPVHEPRHDPAEPGGQRRAERGGGHEVGERTLAYGGRDGVPPRTSGSSG
ncbi:hypothetical protein [Nonomuraea salmonea]|uniref:hypothetical protein n=1 Tax=Nonomuraea salmonea TaxID=46181 RepID=UPI0031ED4A03